MNLILICLSVVYILNPITCLPRTIDTFEFGLNEGQVVFSQAGSMGLWEKIKRIPIIVPECMMLKYVRVDINSMYGPPEVRFIWGTKTLLIEFSPFQSSVSQYTIIAKAVPLRYCRPSLAPSHSLFDIPDFLI